MNYDASFVRAIPSLGSRRINWGPYLAVMFTTGTITAFIMFRPKTS